DSTVSLLSDSAVVLRWCRRKRRRKGGSVIRLGNRRRRGVCVRRRAVVQWGVVVACPLRVLKKMIAGMAANGRLVEAYCWSLPFLRLNLFPLC
ncbi:hypothetical protein MIMGU_mgv1a023575mg, partial [Erythranthe guttata]